MKIEVIMGISCYIMNDVLVAAKTTWIEWPFDEEFTNEDLCTIIFLGIFISHSEYLVQDYTIIHKELAKLAVTLNLL